jgi:hypothetical protein
MRDGSIRRVSDQRNRRVAIGGRRALHREARIRRVSSLIGALVQSARLAGAVFESSIEVSQVESSPNHVEVRAGDRLVPRRSPRSCGRELVEARARDRGARPAGPAGARPAASARLARDATSEPGRVGPRCYTVPWSDGALLVGATVEDVGFDESTTADGVRELTDAVSALLPAPVEPLSSRRARAFARRFPTGFRPSVRSCHA